MNGNSIPIALAAKWLSDIWDQNCALYVMSPIVSQLEAICEKWLKELFELPSGTVAGLRKLGVDAEFRPRNDIEVNGRKISGTGGTGAGSH